MLDLFAQDEKSKEDQIKEIIASFFAEVELCGGPTMSLKKLEEFVYTAPEEVRNTKDFCYLVGLLFSRYMYEVVGGFNPNAKIGPYSPFEELEEFIMSSGEPDNAANAGENKQFKLLRGFYDGRLIHEQFGGINNDDEQQTG